MGLAVAVVFAVVVAVVTSSVCVDFETAFNDSHSIRSTSFFRIRLEREEMVLLRFYSELRDQLIALAANLFN